MKLEKITLGGGCFWCTESVFRSVKGIITTETAYAGGNVENPTYEQVCSGQTAHAEVIQIQYDSESISTEEILLIFMATHDPTSLNQQGGDKGTQYRSVIFYHTKEQEEIAKNIIQELKEHYEKPIVTAIEPIHSYYKAEEYHQNYYEKNPDQAYCNAVIPPKLEKLKKLFETKMK